MENDEYIFTYNQNGMKKRPIIKADGIHYENKKKLVDGTVIKEIIGFINEMNKKYNNTNIPIIMDLGTIEFKDKLTFVILECICNYCMMINKRKICINMKAMHTIWTEGISSSPLKLVDGKKGNVEKFREKFHGEIYGRHYRRVILKEEWSNKYLNSKILEQVDWFLKNLCVEKNNRDKLAEVVAELAGNVHDHTKGDCLIDIDVTTEYTREGFEGSYYGLNLVVLNFSNNLFGDGIKNIIEKDDVQGERYESVKDAYEIHKKMFSDKYEEDDFWNITAFQHKISGRTEKYKTGGTGLTKLIYSLEERSESHNCYMISGNKALFFIQDLLQYNENRWIGFNETNDYFNDKPDNRVLGKSYIYFPGTAYNLNFAMLKEDNIDESV